MKITQVSPSKIYPYEKNAKKHKAKQIQQVADSIKEFGFNQPIVVDKNSVIIVGHARHAAAKKLGLKTVPVLAVEMTEDQAKSYRLADNKLNESDWDMDLVIEELKHMDMKMVDLSGFDQDLLIDPDAKDEFVPWLSKVAQTHPGDIYQLGPHRLICGDSRDMETVEKLMDGKRAQMTFTDPPYNVDYQGGMGTHKKNKRQGIKNDKMSREEFYEFLKAAMLPVVEYTDGGIYVCMSSSELDSLKNAFEESGGHWQSFIVWVKSNFTLSRADYQNTYEQILYGWKDGIINHYFSHRRDMSNVWEDLDKVETEYDGKHTTISFQGFKVKLPGKIEKGEVIKKKQHIDIWRHNKPSRSDEHPTMKPVSLVVEAITNSSQRGDIVLDTFGGSGTTLIACQKTERIGYIQELDPKYVDVIVQRYCEYVDDFDIIKNGKQITWRKT